jgi:hypothetical protein
MALWALTDNLAGAPKWLTPTFTFAAGDVDANAETITIAGHGIEDLSQVTVTGAGITGIKFVKVVGDVIKVYDTLQNATANAAGGLEDLSAAGGTIQVTPTDVFFIDATEAQVSDNRDIGFHVPGWYKYTTRTTAGGATRHDVELLCAVSSSNVASGAIGDAGLANDTAVEDQTVADS